MQSSATAAKHFAKLIACRCGNGLGKQLRKRCSSSSMVYVNSFTYTPVRSGHLGCRGGNFVLMRPSAVHAISCLVVSAVGEEFLS